MENRIIDASTCPKCWHKRVSGFSNPASSYLNFVIWSTDGLYGGVWTKWYRERYRFNITPNRKVDLQEKSISEIIQGRSCIEFDIEGPITSVSEAAPFFAVIASILSIFSIEPQLSFHELQFTELIISHTKAYLASFPEIFWLARKGSNCVQLHSTINISISNRIFLSISIALSHSYSTPNHISRRYNRIIN